ncbi:unnamed protein product [Rangifer tarandus platyrhynchus]|uniref:Uncharacterized protein n=1 Tax=Rangifer tarandus platyrhynchus TaxID=3082113 RepID=A0AC60A6C8_RANTA
MESPHTMCLSFCFSFLHCCWRYCNTRSTHGENRASSYSNSLLQNPESTLSLIEDTSDIKQVRTDTTLDLSQKTRKRYTTYLSIRVTVCAFVKIHTCSPL